MSTAPRPVEPPPAVAVPQRADYGIDAPPVVRNLLFGGAAGLITAAVIHALGADQGAGLLRALARTGLFAGLSWILTALHMIYGSRVRKLRLRDRLLDELALRGGERVLDVGCGRGLMLIGAALRLSRGRAVGIDLWQTADQSGNSESTTRKNAAAEGVADRIELHTSDARRLPFADESFDVILSTWALHNIPDAAGRARAVREIARVLAPGGRVLIVDIQHSRAYVRELRAAGFTDARRRLASLLFVLPSFRVDASKPFTDPRAP
ncbi:MAG: class I SAM-dependent methyltransferase [Polyangia bacterium]